MAFDTDQPMRPRISRAAGTALRNNLAPAFWLVRRPPMAQVGREHTSPHARTKKVTAAGKAIVMPDALGWRTRAKSPNTAPSAAPKARNWAGQWPRRVFQS